MDGKTRRKFYWYFIYLHIPVPKTTVGGIEDRYILDFTKQYVGINVSDFHPLKGINKY